MAEGTGLIKLMSGLWVTPHTVLSINTVSGATFSGATLKPRVELHTTKNQLFWEFDTIEQANKWADHMAVLCNKPLSDAET
jgi:hypothetical protein